MYGKRRERSPEGQGNEQKYVAMEIGRKGDHQEVPDVREVRGFQDPVGMLLAEIPNGGQIEPEETTSSRYAWPPVEGWGHSPISNFLIHNCSCLKETQGQKILEQRMKKRPCRDHCTLGPSHLQTPNPNTIADAKKCSQTGTQYGCPL